MQRQNVVVVARRFGLAAGLGCLAIVANGVIANAARVKSISPAESEAPALVQAALDAELAGDAAKRSELLALALAADPDYGPARWHSGQINFDGAWRTPDVVADVVTRDDRWNGYRELRDSLNDGPEAHQQLAEYCREHGLADEERYHWANVLLAWPGHDVARERLRVREFRGRLFTDEQIAELERLAKTAEKDLARFKPRMTALCRDAISSDDAKRNLALVEIRTLADPACLAALEVAVQKAVAKSQKYAPELGLAAVSALANMPQHEATLRLLNLAVFSPLPEIRQLAAESLRSRPQTDYVPLLMAALTAPIEVEVGVFAAPDGTVRMTETVVQAGPEADRVHTRSVNYETEGALRHNRAVSSPGAVLEANLNRAAEVAADTQDRADAANAEADERNQRIEEVLKVATGKELGDSPEQWWEDWQKYNELQYAEEGAVQETYEEFTSRYYYPQAPVLSPSKNNVGKLSPRREAAPPGPIRRYPNGSIVGAFRTRFWPNGAPRSCFVPGTPVWTQSGPMPIESIVVGDLVLAQNPQTGEVAYRPVLEVTVGEPTGVVNVDVGGETIGSTLGHRFWVNGRGWEMAKYLEPSHQLHAIGGAVEVRSIEKAEIVDCYNLAVDEFHTFFVGKAKILVHDKGCPRPVAASLPGSATLRAPLIRDETTRLTRVGR